MMIKEKLAKITKINRMYVILPITILIVMFVVMAFTGMWPWKQNSYNSYTLQADAWLHGRLDLGQNYEWLELAVFGGKYYVSFPPFPSYVMLPFVLVFGTATPDHWIAIAVTILGVIYALRLCEKFSCNEGESAFFVLFLYLASGFLFIGVNGYVWFIAQNMCFTLSLMSLTYAFEGKGGLALSFWACAVGCRPMAAVYLPFLLFFLWRQWKKENEKGNCSWYRIFVDKWYWGIGVLLIALSYMILNYLRFGSIVEFGHNYLPEFTRTTTGQFNLSYLRENLSHLFRLPSLGEEGGALQFPTADGMAFWLATPLFITIFMAWIYSLIRKRKEQAFSLIVLPILFLVHVFILCCHKTMGGWHFGNRYLLDTLPYLFAGLMLWRPKGKWFIEWNVPLFFLGFALNLVGTVATYNYWI
jgi:hypothetical protein